jgi:sugar/nucleoside kinase (ribokinase family)
MLYPRSPGGDTQYNLVGRYHQVRSALLSSRVQTDILSPNHTEALSLLSLLPTSTDPATLIPLLNQACQTLSSFRPRLGTIIRAGSLGACYILTRLEQQDAHGHEHGHTDSDAEEEEAQVIWVPPYWIPGMEGYESKVVDPTGAGNAFMGGLGAALDQGLNLHDGTYHFRYIHHTWYIGRALLPWNRTAI